jgi:hypothetical protein
MITYNVMKKEVPLSIGIAVIVLAAFLAGVIASNPSMLRLPVIAEVLTKPYVTIVRPHAKAVQELAVLQAWSRVLSMASASITAPKAATTSPDAAVASGLLPKTQSSPTETASANKKRVMRAIPMTAQSFLAATTFSLRERYDGPYEIKFTTDIGADAPITWGLDTTTIGGDGLVQSFTVSSSCDPAPDLPIPGASDQAPTFDPRTSYDCTIDLTPTTGNDQRTQSRLFSFTTPAGQLIVSPPHNMSTVLQSGQNDGGFIFENNDTKAVTVTGLTFDISYTALNLTIQPLVLNILDPISGAVFSNYHLETLATDPAGPYTHAGTGITIPTSLIIGPLQQKILPLQIMGVNTMRMTGIDPTITLTLRDVARDPGNTDGQLLFSSRQISWSCVVPVGAYDPNATSGPYAMGTACR